MAKKATTTDFIERAAKKHNGRYNYSKSVYITAKTKLIIICPTHGEFKQVPNSHLAGNGCRKCWVIRAGDINRKTTNEFIERSTKMHNGKYDYSKSVYINSDTSLIIICPVHGEFTQVANNHMTVGQGCASCSGNNRLTTKGFIEKSTKIHNGEYNYSKSVYTRTDDKVIIICSVHGEFKQTPDHHLSGEGCPKCAGTQKRTTEEFIDIATKIHDGFYSYPKSVYINAHKKLIITCPKHGEFKQVPDSHLQGNGCPNCVSSISKSETLWLNSLNIPKEFRQKTIKINQKNFRADAADTENKIVWEFYGDFWHGNLQRFDSNGINKLVKKTFAELNAKTMAREQAIKDAGYTVISIWESDFKQQLAAR